MLRPPFDLTIHKESDIIIFDTIRDRKWQMTKGNNIYITGDTHGDFIRFSSKFFEVPDKSIIINSAIN